VSPAVVAKKSVSFFVLSHAVYVIKLPHVEDSATMKRQKLNFELQFAVHVF
jgi:hypothetical protein